VGRPSPPAQRKATTQATILPTRRGGSSPRFLGAVNEYERSIISLRLSRGRRLKASRGGYAGGGPRYGYSAAASELEPDATEQLVVGRTSEMYSRGDGSRLIAAALNAEGIPAERGGAWTSASVCRVIRSLAVATLD
jgi:DNA invertase Pin-like site-specific DNA recombinase